MTMLDRMRRHKSWLKWSLALVAVSLTLFLGDYFRGQPTTAAGASSREVVAEVDGDDILAGDFRIRYVQQMQQYRQQFGGNDAILRQLRVEEGILNGMIDERVALREAERKGLTVTDEELAQTIMAFPVFNENGQFIGEQRYRQILQANTPPMTPGEFEDGLRRDMLISKLRNTLTDWMAISNDELDRIYKERNERVKVQVVALTADTFRDKVSASDAEVSAWYDAHKAEYRVGEQRKVKYLLLDPQTARLKVAVTPDEVTRFYDANIERYRTPEQVRASHILFKTAGKDEATVRAHAEDVLKQVKNGGDFAALARKYSEDEASKAGGGDLDYFSRGRMVPEFETAAFSLKPGETSDLVKSAEHGFHIIRVTDRKPEMTQPLDQVRPQIQDQLLAEKANAEVARQASSLSGLKSPAELEKAATAAGLKLEETDFFTIEQPISGLGVSPDASQRAFSLKDGEVAGPITTPRGTVFLTVTGKKEPYVPMLDEVRDRVRNDVIRQKAAELSRARANEIASALSSARDFSAAAKAQGLEAKESQLVTRNSALPDVGISAEVDKAIFALPVGGTTGPIAANDATVIARVVEKQDINDADYRKARESFRAGLLEERRQKFFQSYLTRAREQAKIQINSEVMQRIVSANSSL
jgi:peptidyl-prolyl cis-trans isomerase D